MTFLKNRGFTLVEMMISITLGIFITGGVTSFFIYSSRTNRLQDNLARLQENVRFALLTMTRDIRMAGFRGCQGGLVSGSLELVNMISAPTYTDDFYNGVVGYEAVGSGFSPDLPSDLSRLAPPPRSGSDVLTLRMAYGTPEPLISSMNNSADALAVAADTEFSVGQTLLIEDCASSALFKVTDISDDGKLSHASGPNTQTYLGAAPLGHTFGQGASVWATTTISYFVAPSTEGGYALWQRNTLLDDARELVNGVDEMQLLYGEDTDGDGVPNLFVDANSIANISNVVALRLSLIFSSRDDNITDTPQKFNAQGKSITPSDLRLRKVLSNTISLRNRSL